MRAEYVGPRGPEPTAAVIELTRLELHDLMLAIRQDHRGDKPSIYSRLYRVLSDVVCLKEAPP